MQCSKLIKHFNILIVVTSYRCQNHHLTILKNIYAYTISLCLNFSCTNNRIIISSFIWIRVWKLASFSGKGGVPINRVYKLYSTTMLKISLLLAGYTEKFNSVTTDLKDFSCPALRTVHNHIIRLQSAHVILSYLLPPLHWCCYTALLNLVWPMYHLASHLCKPLGNYDIHGPL